jgi:hypothetical protein
MVSHLYDIAVFLLGDLPQQFSFVYYLFVAIMGLLLLWCLYSPFLIVYKLWGR